MRKKIVAGNWKMYKNLEEGNKLAQELADIYVDEIRNHVQMVLCVPYIHLDSVGKMLRDGYAYFSGAQDCHQETEGAYTGEVSAGQIASTKATYVIIGHSERRQYFDEGASLLLAKIKKALDNGLTPIFCVGETKDIREANTQNMFVKGQLTDVLGKLSKEDMAKVVVAYEPVWAIGTGLTATPGQAQEMHHEIRAALTYLFDAETADAISILYGGSVKAANAAELFAQPDIDGGLVGGASLQSREFADIIKAMR